MNGLLEVNGLTVRGPADCEILAGVDLVLRPGEVLGLVGETGSGKTTLINSVLGLLPSGLHVTAGTVIVDDVRPVDLLALDDRRRRRYLGLHIGYVPQDVRSGLNPLMTARSSVVEAARRQSGNYKDRTETALKKAGLSTEFIRGDADRRPGRLSGGQCQRVLIAQAIVNNPRVLLLDEPTASLDPPTRREVLTTIRGLADERCAVCLVTHDIAAIASVAHVIAVLYLGRLVEIGSANRVLGNPRHPYTRALLGCVPRLERRSQMTAITGDAPATADEVTGCKFHPRCALCEPACVSQEPVLREIQTNQRVACHVVETTIH